MTRNIKIMLALLAIAGLYVFMLGCDDVTVSVDGGIEDWNVTGLDSAIDDAASSVLDPLDDAVKALRDSEQSVIEWSYEAGGKE